MKLHLWPKSLNLLILPYNFVLWTKWLSKCGGSVITLPTFKPTMKHWYHLRSKIFKEKKSLKKNISLTGSIISKCLWLAYPKQKFHKKLLREAIKRDLFFGGVWIWFKLHSLFFIWLITVSLYKVTLVILEYIPFLVCWNVTI